MKRRMKRRLAASAGALLLLALIVIAAAPARLVWRHSVVPQLPQLEAAEVSGPWWRGKVQGLSWKQVDLGTLSWHPGADGWRLKLAAGDQARLAAHAPWDFDGQRLNHVAGRWPARVLAPLLPATPGGSLHLTLDSVSLTPGLRITGSARWRDANLGGAVDVALGEVAIDLKPAASGTRIRLSSHQAGTVMIRGTGRLHDDGGYRFRVDLRAAPAQDALARQLRRLGRSRPDGSVRITLEDNG